jgi:ribosome-associated toxin RatA of RatAB toxin-antitoxin module
MPLLVQSIVIGVALCSLALAATQKSIKQDEEEGILRFGGIIKESREIEGSNLKEVTVIGVIDAEPEYVWDVIVDYENYQYFMPRTIESTVDKREGTIVYFYSELDMPLFMSNVSYVIKILHDKKQWRITFNLVPGTGKNVRQIRGSWKLEPFDIGKTKTTYTLFTEPETSIPDVIINIATDFTLGEILEAIRVRVKNYPVSFPIISR